MNNLKNIFIFKKETFNTALKILILISGFFMFAYAMLTPLYAIFVEKIGGGISTAANSYALFWAVAGIMTFVIGKIESKIEETELAIAYSQFIVGLAYVLLYFTWSPTLLYISMIILGIGNAMYWPAFHAVYSRHTNKANATEQWSIYDGMAYLIPAFGAAIGGVIVNNFGFGSLFIIMSIICFFCGIFIIILPRRIL